LLLRFERRTIEYKGRELPINQQGSINNSFLTLL
jgi:hypothetical protein